MRKLLLAGAAVMGLASAAQAQVGLVTTPTPPGVSGPYAAAQPAPAPGQVAVRLNGGFNWYFGFAAEGDASHNGEKLSNTGMKSYIRLYPGFDGVAANGLKYGVVSEIRQDNTAAATDSPTVAARSRGVLYWRRAYGYIGGDSWGKVQFGSGDGPVSAMGGIGHYYNIGTGNICGDAPNFNATGAGPWPMISCNGSMYTTNKVVYYSPQISGFDFGVAYEPGTGNLQASNECGTTGAGCDLLSTTDTADYKRRRNTFDMAARYRGSFGGVGVAAVGGYLTSGHISNTYGTYGSSTRQGPVDGMHVGYGGITVDFAGFSFGGALQGGDQNGTGLKFTTGESQFAWVVGATYTMGPAMFGVTAFQSASQGNWSPISKANANHTRYDRGFEAALNYGIAPGLSATLEYIWGDSKQANIDLISARGGTQDTVTQQMLVGGMHLKW